MTDTLKYIENSNLPFQLDAYEIAVLEMLAGKRDWEQGSWVNACFEFLKEMGYATRTGITEAGLDYLEKKGLDT